MTHSDNFQLVVHPYFEKKLQDAYQLGWVLLPAGRPAQLEACIEVMKRQLKDRASECCTDPTSNIIRGGDFGSLACSYVIDRTLVVEGSDPPVYWCHVYMKFNVFKNKVLLYDVKVIRVDP